MRGTPPSGGATLREGNTDAGRPADHYWQLIVDEIRDAADEGMDWRGKNGAEFNRNTLDYMATNIAKKL